MRSRAPVVFALALALGILLAPTAQAASPLMPSTGNFLLGYGDPELTAADPAARQLWTERAVTSGASLVRFNVRWAEIAPTSPPPGFDPADPNSPGYSWASLDASVRTATSNGLGILFTVLLAPSWAEEPGRPAGIRPGTWSPRAGPYGAFAQALAERYNGSFPDPLHPGATLPRVRYFEAWNEPNLDNYLAPQERSNGRLVGPTIYRRLLNRFYAGVKASQPGAKVLGASFAPFGNETGNLTPPILFLRNLLCLRGGHLKPFTCPEKAHLDILSAHPIQVGPPAQSAPSPFDVTTPDLGRLTKVVEAARRAGTILPATRKGLWVTEFWVDSNPPDPLGIPVARQARWYAQDLHEFWVAGAEVAIELQLRDSSPGDEGFANTLQSGIYFVNGEAKPSQKAMSFPFVASRSGTSSVSVWGIAPRQGSVQIQVRRGGTWRRLASVLAQGRGHPFTATVQLRGAAQLRARLGAELSLPWQQG